MNERSKPGVQRQIEHPWMRTRRGKILSRLGLWGTMGLAMIGMTFARCMPSDLAVDLGLVAGAIVALGWMAMADAGVRARSEQGDVDRRMANPWVRRPIMLLVGFMFGYSGFAWGVPWMVNAAFGTKSEQIVTVTGWISGGRHSCPGPEVDRAPFFASVDALCMPVEARSEMTPGTRLRLVGPATFLGLNVQKVYVLH